VARPLNVVDAAKAAVGGLVHATSPTKNRRAIALLNGRCIFICLLPPVVAGTNFPTGQPNRCRNRHRLVSTRRYSGPLLLAERTREAAIGMSLSRREIEVLEHVARGETSKEIAAALGIRERTVNWHISQTFTRLGAGSRSEAVAIAMERGIVRGPHDSRTTP